MTFTQLQALVGSPGAAIRIRRDSRRVGKGDIFVAISGTGVDGHDFIDQALENGAGYIVTERPLDCGGAEAIVVQSSTEALGLLAQQRYGTPSAKLTNLAVTGTNGKTTVSYLVRSIIEAAGRKCGLIGTIVYDTGANSQDAPLTTPDALDIARMGAEMLSWGAEFMVIEASSHALSQNRLAGVDFTAAAFTNLTGDHLDYHGTTEEYLAAKTRLFSALPAHATSILNAQSPASEAIARRTRTRKLWYAVDAEADIVAHIDSMDINQTRYRLEFNGIRHDVTTSMPGRHNISNHLAAAGLCLAAGFDIFAVTKGLSALKCVPGRLEPVDCGQDFSVFIDYAHTDDA
ncbi:MAG: UDP-N-acetylmuramyl-tripeptide synthetase, partial [Planctomycetes bacterium]|nr:UDP-N-acetylmuramyl-tripeptide synthetase [Planctomycetota bacterium]